MVLPATWSSPDPQVPSISDPILQTINDQLTSITHDLTNICNDITDLKRTITDFKKEIPHCIEELADEQCNYDECFDSPNDC